MILIPGESLLAMKLYLIMMSFMTTPTSFSSVKRKYVVGKIAKPRAVPTNAGVSTFATAKSNNSSNYILLGVQKFLPVGKVQEFVSLIQKIIFR